MKIPNINKIVPPLRRFDPGDCLATVKPSYAPLKPQTLDEFMQTPIVDHDDFLIKMVPGGMIR